MIKVTIEATDADTALVKIYDGDDLDRSLLLRGGAKRSIYVNERVSLEIESAKHISVIEGRTLATPHIEGCT